MALDEGLRGVYHGGMTPYQRLRRSLALVNWRWHLRHPITSTRFSLACYLPLSRPWRDRIGGDYWTGGQNPDDSG